MSVRGGRIVCCPALWYDKIFWASGNNSVVECDLAKVEVAGSNPVSRSNFRLRSVGPLEIPHLAARSRSLGPTLSR